MQLALIEEGTPILGVIYLPITDTLYWAERGVGAFRDNKPLRMTRERNLKNVLCGFGLDATPDDSEGRSDAELLFRVAGGVRNIRCTNSLIDFC